MNYKRFGNIDGSSTRSLIRNHEFSNSNEIRNLCCKQPMPNFGSYFWAIWERDYFTNNNAKLFCDVSSNKFYLTNLSQIFNNCHFHLSSEEMNQVKTGTENCWERKHLTRGIGNYQSFCNNVLKHTLKFIYWIFVIASLNQ